MLGGCSAVPETTDVSSPPHCQMRDHPSCRLDFHVHVAIYGALFSNILKIWCVYIYIYIDVYYVYLYIYIYIDIDILYDICI